MKLILPQLPPKINLRSIANSQLAEEASLERISLANAKAVGLAASNMSLEESLLEKVLLTEAKLEKLGLKDVVLKACDFSAARCSESSLLRVHILGGRLAGIDLSQTTLRDVIFEDCKLDMANFRFAKLTRVQFMQCSLVEADFQMAELGEIEFQSSQLEQVEFNHCKLKQVDARSSQLIDIRGWQSLKGLTIDTSQLMAVAPQLAVELGLTIKE